MHMQCLQHWQALLHATKGVAAARRCDVCKERWAKCYQPPAVPTDWRTMLRVPQRALAPGAGGARGQGSVGRHAGDGGRIVCSAVPIM